MEKINIFGLIFERRYEIAAEFYYENHNLEKVISGLKKKKEKEKISLLFYYE